MKKQILNQAIDDLSFAIMHLSQDIKFEIYKETTNNFEVMKNDYEKTIIGYCYGAYCRYSFRSKSGNQNPT